MRISLAYIVFILFFLILGCQDVEEEQINWDKSFNIILIVGQSNTHGGIGLDPSLDFSESRIKQLGRFGVQNLQIIEAIEPLHHHSRKKDKIGFGLTFAKEYIKYFESDSNDVLIIPCGFGGTGFIDDSWNKGDDLYEDAVSRVGRVMWKYPNSKLRVILWHQGEADIENNNYENDLDRFINDFRGEFSEDLTPFILGGMVPYWVNKFPVRQVRQETIKQTPERISELGYVDPTYPFLIEKEDNEFNEVHYNAQGQRELGKRYFAEFIKVTGH